MTQTIWIARHGNRQDFVDPHWAATAERPHDPALSEDGIEQAERLGRRLVGEGITHIFASPFLRTVQTAHYVAEALDLRFSLEPGFGEWQNPAWFPSRPAPLPYAVLAERFPRIDLTHQPLRVPGFPEAEAEASARADATARALARQYSGTLLLVGHGITVSGAVRGLVPDVGPFETALCGLFKVVLGDAGRWSAALCGDVSHLEASLGADRFN